MNPSLEGTIQNFIDGLDAEAHRLWLRGNFDASADYASAHDALERFFERDMECEMENEAERRGVARDEAALRDGWSGAAEMQHLQAEARKLK